MTANKQQNIFDELKLRHIIQVDDANVLGATEPQQDFASLWPMGAAITDVDFWSGLGVVYPEKKPNSWERTLKYHWSKLASDEEKRQFFEQVAKKAEEQGGVGPNADQQFQDYLKEHFDERFKRLSLGEWRVQSRDLIARAQKDGETTLVLFDLHFERESDQARLGIQLLKENKDVPELLLGILSHDASIENEPQAWQDIADEADVDIERFVVISKKRISSPDDYPLLDGFRRVVFAKTVKKIKEQALSILDESVKSAVADIKKINVYDFERAVFRSSLNEGVWEGDTFCRIFNSNVQRYAQENTHKSQELHKELAQLRAHFYNPRLNVPQSHNVWKLLQNEIYENSNFVNNCYLPISNGDIFQVRTGDDFSERDKFFVLIGQPCDLAVRHIGYRNKGDERALGSMAYLIEVFSFTKELDKERLDMFKLPYFDQGSEIFYARTSHAHHVWLTVLDLCVFNSNGIAFLNLDDTTVNEHLLPGWVTRKEKIKEYFNDLLKRIPNSVTDPTEKQNLIDALLPQACRTLSILSKIIQNEDKYMLDYGIKRVKRLTSSWAAALLSQATISISRHAFEHDLTRE